MFEFDMHEAGFVAPAAHELENRQADWSPLLARLQLPSLSRLKPADVIVPTPSVSQSGPLCWAAITVLCSVTAPESCGVPVPTTRTPAPRIAVLSVTVTFVRLATRLRSMPPPAVSVAAGYVATLPLKVLFSTVSWLPTGGLQGPGVQLPLLGPSS